MCTAKNNVLLGTGLRHASQCAEMCRGYPRCRFFVFGHKGSAKGHCKFINIWDASCPAGQTQGDGLQPDPKYDFYELLNSGNK